MMLEIKGLMIFKEAVDYSCKYCNRFTESVTSVVIHSFGRYFPQRASGYFYNQ